MYIYIYHTHTLYHDKKWLITPHMHTLNVVLREVQCDTRCDKAVSLDCRHSSFFLQAKWIKAMRNPVSYSGIQRTARDQTQNFRVVSGITFSH